MKAYAQVAVSFAEALVRGEFESAAAMLTPSLRLELTAGTLTERLDAMYRDYADGPPTSVHFDEELGPMDEWPGRRPGDLGRAYVSISGNDFVEALEVIVADVDGVALIREVEWGRP